MPITSQLHPQGAKGAVGQDAAGFHSYQEKVYCVAHCVATKVPQFLLRCTVCCIYSERLTRVNNITTQKPRMMAQFLKGGLMRIGSAACRFRSPADVVINSDGYIADVWRNYLNYSKTLKITRHSRF
jgi:hypothetical protein